MTHTKANQSKILALILGLTMCLALMLGIAMAGALAARADDGEKTTIESVGVSFNKTKIGDKLASMFQFEDETKKTLVVPEGANYTARIEMISAYGHTRRLWSDAPGYLWSTIESSEITRDTPYVVRVRFEPKTGYIFDASKEAEYLSAMNIPGFEIGKGKDIEVWATNLFKGWKDESGEIVSTKKEYTFTVTGETTLTAVYEDKLPIGSDTGDLPGSDTGDNGEGPRPPKPAKKGISGGQVAGIVIGSVAVAGIGGFAIFWFAIRKKSFADLITAIKVLFTKKK